MEDHKHRNDRIRKKLVESGWVEKVSKPTLDAAVIRELAVKASVDPRTILRVFRGEPVRGMSGKRAKDILVREGLLRTGEED